MDKDVIYRHPLPESSPFRFDESVARVFPDMIKRSVPGYAEVLAITGLVAADYIRPGANCYDLGCAVGASAAAILQRVKQADYHVIAVDNSPPMLDRCRRLLADIDGGDKATCLRADIEQVEITNAAVVVLNYTLQFIAPARRQSLLKKIHRGMNTGGVLVLSEKLAFDSESEQRRQTALHESFKRARGYSELEISQKRAALENVLTPESSGAHLRRLRAVGFRDAQLWFRSINFASMLAWK